MSYKETIDKEIASLNLELKTRNDAISYATDLFSVCRDQVSETFTKVNSSQSYDEKVDGLVSGLKMILQVQEKSLLDLMSVVKSLNDKKAVLDSIIDQNSSKEESKKKDQKPLGTEQDETVPQ